MLMMLILVKVMIMMVAFMTIIGSLRYHNGDGGKNVA